MGHCHNDKCLLSHTVAPEKMPSCKFFLEGLCTKENCPYRHVKVNPDAEICHEYLQVSFYFFNALVFSVVPYPVEKYAEIIS